MLIFTTESIVRTRRATLFAQGWSKGRLVTPFGPTVEPESEAHIQRLPGTFNPNHFLPDYPENLVKLGRYRKVPWIAGVNSKAGYSDFVASMNIHTSKYFQYLIAVSCS